MDVLHVGVVSGDGGEFVVVGGEETVAVGNVVDDVLENTPRETQAVIPRRDGEWRMGNGEWRMVLKE